MREKERERSNSNIEKTFMSKYAMHLHEEEEKNQDRKFTINTHLKPAENMHYMQPVHQGITRRKNVPL